ncbi:MAG: DUF2256 domain-containing protein [Zhengella sp.]|uniref:DUF2256 domain-containing protein n=1 Tax=Zhengella sp. TaxID=2282762 RepID=UPI001DDA8123|nr:DUF2256 domain-containing protein [Notoacmeibacter sp.]MCC0025647.1 DUF2256 domain-containing protein [Brucellaceae bacterium]
MDDKPAKRHLKRNGLPQKICAACGRPFAWRRKWARDWENVRYCSDRCKRARGRGSVPESAPLRP